MNDYYWQLCQACRSGNVFMPWHIRDSDGLGGGSQTYYSTDVLRGEPQAKLRMWGPDGKEIPVEEGYWFFFIAYIHVPYVVLPDEPGRYRLTESYPAPYKPQRWAGVGAFFGAVTGLFVAIGHDPRSELVRGQVHGGLVQGIGQALTEACVISSGVSPMTRP